MARHQAASGAGGRSLPPFIEPIILIAEDEPINQLMMRAALTKAGCHSKIATDGEEAVALVEGARSSARPYTLVLMDLQMPRMDGFEAARRIRSMGISEAELPIIAFTAGWSRARSRDCRQAGMQDAVPKPLAGDALMQLVERWCRKRGNEDAQGSLFDRDEEVGPSPAPEIETMYLARKATLAALLAAAVDEDRAASPSCEDIANALHKVAGVAGQFGEDELGAVAAGLEPVFEAARSIGDATRLARHAIAQLEPLGLQFTKREGEKEWPGS